MLPGFRFLFAAIVFSLSILVFGLGAAALLRAAHEQFASNPSWRGAPEIMLTQRSETSRPVLTMLRVEPAPKPDNVPAMVAPAEPAIVAAPPEPAAVAAPAEPERMAALKPEISSPPETTKPETPAAQDQAPAEAAAQADAPAAAEPTSTAATEQSLPPANEVVPTAVEAVPAATEVVPTAAAQASAPASPETEVAETKIATLGGLAVAIEPPPRSPAKAASEKPKRDVIKKRQQARRAAQRRNVAAHARIAQQPLQPATDPFTQPTITVRKR